VNISPLATPTTRLGTAHSDGVQLAKRQLVQGHVSVPKRHALQLIQQPSPIISQHLGVLDPFSRPVLVPATDVVLCRLESDELVADALLDKNGPIVLLNNGLLVL
jgi:hypothetical protein